MDSNNELKLWYRQPAKEWVEALPIGNGRLGAMIFGDVFNERIQFNEDTLWTGMPITEEMGSLAYLEKARKLIFSGEYLEAQKIINENLLGPWNQSYAPMGNLYIDFEEEGKVEEYIRELDLNQGCVRISYKIEDAEYKREIFVSKPDEAIVIKLFCNKKMSFNIRFDSLLKYSVDSYNDETLSMNGKAPIYALPSYEDGENPIVYDKAGRKGMNFKVLVNAKSDKGNIKIKNGILSVCDSNEVVLKLIAYTSFNGFDKEAGTEGKNVNKLCEENLKRIRNKSFDTLKNNHINEYELLFKRVDFSLGDSFYRKMPTDERVKRFKNDKEDLSLIALYFQYGRYLLISSSRGNCQPANLQGIWNEDLRPAWSSNYTTNINLEMNYWPAEVCNLSECHNPLFKMLDEVAQNGKRTAKVRYGCSGWTANHNIDLWRQTAPAGGSCEWAYWPMAASWLCSHIWEHYQFTQDKYFLKKNYYLMKGAAEFLIDWLIEDKDGYLVTCPSISPENNFLTKEGKKCSPSIASTMDMSIVRNLFTNCIKAEEILNNNKDFRIKLESMLEKLYPYKVGKEGQLQEWFADFEEFEPGHRHLSHLFSLYPGNEVTEESNKEIFEAMKVSLERRLSNGGGHTGWSCAWVICLYARMKNKEMVEKYINVLIEKLTFINLFNICPPFQIDGNFGGTAAVAEALLQSHKGYIELLPALPPKWTQGKIQGLKARGNFEVSIKWSNSKLEIAEIKANCDSKCRIKYDELNIEIKDIKNISLNNGIIEFNASKGETYIIVPKSE